MRGKKAESFEGYEQGCCPACYSDIRTMLSTRAEDAYENGYPSFEFVCENCGLEYYESYGYGGTYGYEES